MLPILVAAVWPQGACKADLSEQLRNDSSVSRPCSVYSDQLIAYSPEGGIGGSELGQGAIGAPDGKVVSITTNAVLTVAFLGLGAIEEATGDDIRIHGSVGADAEIAVFLGFGDDDLVFGGSLQSGDLDIDIATGFLRIVSYIQFVGISGEASIDAIEALQTQCPAE